MNRVCLMLLIWLAVFSQLSSTGVVLLSFLQLDIPAWLTGVGRLAAACGTVGLVLIWKRRPFWQNVMFARSGRPRAGEVLLWVLCLLALQGAAGLLQSLLSPAMEFFRTKSKVVSGTAETTVSLALYTAVAAPHHGGAAVPRGRAAQPAALWQALCHFLLGAAVRPCAPEPDATPFAFGFGLLAGYVAVGILHTLVHEPAYPEQRRSGPRAGRPAAAAERHMVLAGDPRRAVPSAAGRLPCAGARLPEKARRAAGATPSTEMAAAVFRTPGWIIFLVLSCVCIILNFFVLGPDGISRLRLSVSAVKYVRASSHSCIFGLRRIVRCCPR